MEKSYMIFWLGIAEFHFQHFPAFCNNTKYYKDFLLLESWKVWEDSWKVLKRNLLNSKYTKYYKGK
jgi:hypothetical protein